MVGHRPRSACGAAVSPNAKQRRLQLLFFPAGLRRCSLQTCRGSACELDRYACGFCRLKDSGSYGVEKLRCLAKPVNSLLIRASVRQPYASARGTCLSTPARELGRLRFSWIAWLRWWRQAVKDGPYRFHG